MNMLSVKKLKPTDAKQHVMTKRDSLFSCRENKRNTKINN